MAGAGSCGRLGFRKRLVKSMKAAEHTPTAVAEFRPVSLAGAPTRLALQFLFFAHHFALPRTHSDDSLWQIINTR
jgi:hypothetical protein